MTAVNEMLSNSLTIPDDVWVDLDIAMNENEFEVLQHEAFDVTSNDFLEIAPESSDDTNDLDLDQDYFRDELAIESLKQQSYRINSTSDTASPTMVASDEFMKTTRSNSSAMDTDASVHSAQLPFLTSSELDQRMEQSVSRLALSMKRSEMSRQRILQNGGGYHQHQTNMFSTFIGTSSTLATGISHGRKAVGSYMYHVGNATM
jgi:hypothetical protein|eukprot:720691_1